VLQIDEHAEKKASKLSREREEGGELCNDCSFCDKKDSGKESDSPGRKGDRGRGRVSVKAGKISFSPTGLTKGP